MDDRRDRRDPRDRGDERARRDNQGAQGTGQSRFAQRGISHEERMHDDDSARRFPGRTGPDPRGSQGEPYGSGGSYGYGGGFEHGGEGGYENRDNQGRPGAGNEEFYEATGGFGHDVSGYGREGLGWPGRNEQRLGTSGGADHRRQPQQHRDDPQKGYSQDSGYAQSGGERPEGGDGGRGGNYGRATPGGGNYARGYGPPSAHSDGRGHEGGGRPSQRFEGHTPSGQPGRGRFYGSTPKGYTRSDERIREDVCDQLSHGHIDPSDISVTVQGGVVTLEGYIISRSEKFHAEEVADSVLGVKEVDNRLRVKREQTDKREQQTEQDTKASSAQSGGASPTISESETMNEAQAKEAGRAKTPNGARS